MQLEYFDHSCIAGGCGGNAVLFGSGKDKRVSELQQRKQVKEVTQDKILACAAAERVALQRIRVTFDLCALTCDSSVADPEHRRGETDFMLGRNEQQRAVESNDKADHYH